ncbi:hypothetical protein CBR_g3744 [Chara braunii]|uniref:Integrase catalytic domain-containing protein n=1 Tax=Chara braunii TaxID=69332 RepID=A0A388KG97_CHABU|nr:hypothetical protein CBR_g3744 [Chara braunii]|eukprot:GBG69046.1 hypothetical protein CBR_g3744 [Chara braunii]
MQIMEKAEKQEEDRKKTEKAQRRSRRSRKIIQITSSGRRRTGRRRKKKKRKEDEEREEKKNKEEEREEEEEEDDDDDDEDEDEDEKGKEQEEVVMSSSRNEPRSRRSRERRRITGAQGGGGRGGGRNEEEEEWKGSPMTSGNHPEANGQAEQLNRAVQHLLRHYIKPNQVEWDEKLALIASLYNNVVHSATGVSPNSLLLTFKPRLPLDFLLPENQQTVAPGTLEFAYRYEQTMQQAVEQMQKAQAAMIESENKHCRPSTFQVGDRVWVKSSELGQEHGISRKLMPQYFGTSLPINRLVCSLGN